MAGVAAANPRHQFFDTDGNPLAGGFVYTYLAGTTTLTTTWQDRAQTTENENPIELDAAGACQIVLDTALTYKFVVTNSAGVTQSHLGADNVVGAAGASVLADAIADIQAEQATAEAAIGGLVTQAENALADAETARDTAENYAAAAATGAVFYDTIAAGLAAVSSGATFGVKAGGSDGLTRPTIYRDDAGVATRLYAVLPGSEFDASFVPEAPGDDGWALSDENGFDAVRVSTAGDMSLGGDLTVSGTLNAADLSVTELTAESIAGPTLGVDDDYAYTFEDENGFIVAGITADGEFQYVGQNDDDALIYATQEDLTTVVTVGPVTTIAWYGQSNAVGWDATDILSGTQPFDNVMYSGGSLVDLISVTWERPHVTAANYATATRVRKQGGEPGDEVLAAFTAGVGGASITELQSGSSGYTSFVSNITNLYGQENGLTVPVMNFVQGETDTEDLMDGATWTTAMETLRGDLQTSIQGVIGGTDPLHVVLTQPAYKVTLNDDIVLAQLALTRTNPLHYFLSCPMYRMPYDGTTHVSSVGAKLMGAYFGRDNAAILDGKKPQWLDPISAEYSGSTVTIRFRVPVQPLALDTTALAAATNYGFKVTDSGGTKTISSVTAGTDTVTIVCSTTLSGTVTVRYALDYLGTGLTITSGASGNLRDSDPELITIDGTEYQLFNAAPHFSLTAYSLEV